MWQILARRSTSSSAHHFLCVQAPPCTTHIVLLDAQRSTQEREALHLIALGRHGKEECASAIGQRSGSISAVSC
jgi:hypothetical protein